eukprot:8975595-Pyramimonas_sp.AAC.1
MELKDVCRVVSSGLQFGKIVLTTSVGIMDHEEARRKKTGGKVRTVMQHDTIACKYVDPSWFHIKGNGSSLIELTFPFTSKTHTQNPKTRNPNKFA